MASGASRAAETDVPRWLRSGMCCRMDGARGAQRTDVEEMSGFEMTKLVPVVTGFRAFVMVKVPASNSPTKPYTPLNVR
jgi:hypothetical protein